MSRKHGRLLALGSILMSTWKLKRDALEIFKEIGAIDVENRWEAAKRCWKWLEQSRDPTASFAVVAASKYLVAAEKKRNTLIEKYNGLRASLLLRGASVKKLPALEPTRYSKMRVDKT